MSGVRTEKAGAALATALGGDESPADAEAGRSLLLGLIRLHELGALAFQGDANLSTAPGPTKPGPVVRSARSFETGDAYNIASLSASEAESA